MADPYQYVENTGLIIPDTADIVTGVQAEYQAGFGSDLRVTPDTPQGVLITTDAIARTETVQNNAAVANQINPNAAGGVFLDAIMALTGQQRIAATQSIIPGVTLLGVAGTEVPAGSIAQTTAGDQYSSLATVVLDGGGSATVNFASVEFGPIPCDAATLTTIVSNVLGWETVNNASAGTLGQNTQSDQAARAYRNNTLGFQGVALPVAITSALSAVSGVQSLTFQENVAATTQTINGISMVAHSVYACVNGGADVDVAAALLENKSSGAAWNGGTSVNVVEPASGQIYTVKFDRPTPIGVYVQVTSNGNAAAIKQAVLDFANGLIAGLSGFVVGGAVSPFDIAYAIVSEIPGLLVNSVQLAPATDPTDFSTDTMLIDVNEIATTQLSYISVVLP